MNFRYDKTTFLGYSIDVRPFRSNPTEPEPEIELTDEFLYQFQLEQEERKRNEIHSRGSEKLQDDRSYYDKEYDRVLDDDRLYNPQDPIAPIFEASSTILKEYDEFSRQISNDYLGDRYYDDRDHLCRQNDYNNNIDYPNRSSVSHHETPDSFLEDRDKYYENRERNDNYNDPFAENTSRNEPLKRGYAKRGGKRGIHTLFSLVTLYHS